MEQNGIVLGMRHTNALQRDSLHKYSFFLAPKDRMKEISSEKPGVFSHEISGVPHMVRYALERHYDENRKKDNNCIMCGDIEYKIFGNGIACATWYYPKKNELRKISRYTGTGLKLEELSARHLAKNAKVKFMTAGPALKKYASEHPQEFSKDELDTIKKMHTSDKRQEQVKLARLDRILPIDEWVRRAEARSREYSENGTEKTAARAK